MSGYTAIGGGIGAAVLWDGMLNVVAGPLFAQIERERVEGPRYAEALRGARKRRQLAAWRKWPDADGRPAVYSKEWPSEGRATVEARTGGVPVGWLSR